MLNHTMQDSIKLKHTWHEHTNNFLHFFSSWTIYNHNSWQHFWHKLLATRFSEVAGRQWSPRYGFPTPAPREKTHSHIRPPHQHSSDLVQSCRLQKIKTGLCMWACRITTFIFRGSWLPDLVVLCGICCHWQTPRCTLLQNSHWLDEGQCNAFLHPNEFPLNKWMHVCFWALERKLWGVVQLNCCVVLANGYFESCPDTFELLKCFNSTNSQQLF